MPVDLVRAPNALYLLTFSGIVRPAEFRQSQAELLRDIEAGGRPRILAFLQNFGGFESGSGWNDLEFQFAHGDDILKIAIVGEPQWESDALTFAGAGFRKAPVRYFGPGEEARARVWLASKES